MKKVLKDKKEEAFQKELGRRIEAEIKRKGYESVYDFWIRKAGDDMSRATLNYIVAGKHDVKINTLRTLSKLIGVKLKDLLDFE